MLQIQPYVLADPLKKRTDPDLLHVIQTISARVIKRRRQIKLAVSDIASGFDKLKGGGFSRAASAGERGGG